ncbi:enoyl-CoA hydratase/isomerase family protein [Pigmentiphaga sp. H8]|uniref:enoyl-CoA hydratase/isomerase family protein n=1 Tax=Pigmentiphaga sp. H8 TaxID=2488560 RepID=UPI000F5A9AF4|nr:enoyl-CoA hydratase/isomerase family protein [Pigmentiphaga sp. H8]AZG07992.1 enoyl-CoA hydratase/isomerase family protein [Pigmentiphaga sp. H8]
MDEPLVQVETGTVVTVTLNRPAALNAFDHSLRSALTDTLLDLENDAGVRAIVLTGMGERAFSAGQDLHEAAAYRPQDIPAWMSHQRAMYQAVRASRKPLVAAFNGLAAGSGFHLGLMADLRVGFADMQLGQPEIRMGLASIVGPFLMSRHLGQGRISEFAIAGRMISGQRAHELGLINDLVPRAEVLAHARSLARELAGHPSQALALTKEHFVAQTQREFDQAFDAVIRCHQAEYATGEPQALMRGFLETRRQQRLQAESTEQRSTTGDRP